jgi:hypothetical protein
MSRPSKPKAAAPVAAAAPETLTAAPSPVTPDPASPQVPETTGAEAALAATAAAPVVPDPEVKPPVATGFVLRVKGPAKGRWRAGRHFGPEPVDIPAADLTEEQIALLNGDPELTVLVLGEA